jgi:hypothetical protein
MASLVVLAVAGCGGEQGDEVTSSDQALVAQRAESWNHYRHHRHHHHGRPVDPFCWKVCEHKECGDIAGPGHHECDCGDCEAPETCGGGGVPNQCGGGGGGGAGMGGGGTGGGCTPRTASEACGTQNCGTAPDGCGGTVSCGTCGAPLTCIDNQCVASTINVTSATYGLNCGAMLGNATDSLGVACNGLTECTYTIDYRIIGDPVPGCGKDYRAEYTCLGDPTVRSASVGGESGYGSQIVLSCL